MSDPSSSPSSGKNNKKGLPVVHLSLDEMYAIDTAFDCLANEYPLTDKERNLFAKIKRMIRQMERESNG